MIKRYREFEGRILSKIEGLEEGSYEVTFYCTDGAVFKMYPEDDTFCWGNGCECSICDICGDVNDLIGSKILKAKESSNRDKYTDGSEEVWTFYSFATIKGYVDIRWYGQHNGYYTAEVNFYQEK